jgi:hypothetical protein
MNMGDWFKRRLESILDNLIFAGIVAGGIALWTALKSLPLPVIVGASAGIFILILVAVRLTFLFVIKKQAKPRENWIDAYKARYGKLPLLPDYLRPVCESHPIDQPVSKDMELKTPSGQLWNSWTPTQREEWRQLVEWCGKNPEDYLAHMRRMLPKTPSGVERIRYRPHDQH